VRRPQIIDTFMVNNELDLLAMRLEEMSPAVDWFVAVEADVDHQNHPKPYHVTEHLGDFAEWKSKLVVVRATGLPTTPHDEDPWAREWAQRDWTWQGLDQIPDLDPGDVVLHGDIDELCRPLFVRNCRPKRREFIAFGQQMYCFAIDWHHPEQWGGTVAVTVETARACGTRTIIDGEIYHPGAWQIVRNQRNGLVERNFEHLGTGWRWSSFTDAGWHFSWIGGKEAAKAKLGSFCHPEISDRVAVGLETNSYMREGFHVDGVRMEPVDVDDTWPAMIAEHRCPPTWFRPR
jgi:beta-1,4-mannosyl-glycoprotein beta-1,4-N-acetylglucosaminyltransferase